MGAWQKSIKKLHQIFLKLTHDYLWDCRTVGSQLCALAKHRKTNSDQLSFNCGRLDDKNAVEALLAPLESEIRVPAFEILKPELQLGEDIAVFSFNLSEQDQDGALMIRWKATEISR